MMLTAVSDKELNMRKQDLSRQYAEVLCWITFIFIQRDHSAHCFPLAILFAAM